jgi:lysozyme family protein
MPFSPAFIRAVSHCMIYEVGGFFNPNDKETAIGLIDTAAQRKKVGYTNDPTDRGGETKYGIAKSGNPTVDITHLTWAGAMAIYEAKYWQPAGCALLNARVAILHFDGAVNHGVGRENKFLQEIVHAVQDGAVGPGTAKLANAMNDLDRREKYYRDIVAANPSQARFINGWLRRINEMRDFVQGPLS